MFVCQSAVGQREQLLKLNKNKLESLFLLLKTSPFEGNAVV